MASPGNSFYCKKKKKNHNTHTHTHTITQWCIHDRSRFRVQHAAPCSDAGVGHQLHPKLV